MDTASLKTWTFDCYFVVEARWKYWFSGGSIKCLSTTMLPVDKMWKGRCDVGTFLFYKSLNWFLLIIKRSDITVELCNIFINLRSKSYPVLLFPFLSWCHNDRVKNQLLQVVTKEFCLPLLAELGFSSSL